MKSVLAVAVVSLLLASSALGSVITMSPTAPSSNVTVSQVTRDSQNDLVWRQDAHQFFGQTFTATSGGASAISVMVKQENSIYRMGAGMDITLKLWDAAGDVTARSGTVLATAQGLTPDFAKGTYQWMTFELPQTALTVGSIYGFTVDFASLGDYNVADRNWKIGGDYDEGMQVNTNNVYAGGQAFRDYYGTNYYTGSEDLAFAVQNVPEPTTMVLLALGS